MKARDLLFCGKSTGRKKTGSRHRMSPDVHRMRTIEEILIFVHQGESPFLKQCQAQWAAKTIPR